MNNKEFLNEAFTTVKDFGDNQKSIHQFLQVTIEANNAITLDHLHIVREAMSLPNERIANLLSNKEVIPSRLATIADNIRLLESGYPQLIADGKSDEAEHNSERITTLEIDKKTLLRKSEGIDGAVVILQDEVTIWNSIESACTASLINQAHAEKKAAFDELIEQLIPVYKECMALSISPCSRSVHNDRSNYKKINDILNIIPNDVEIHSLSEALVDDIINPEL